MDLVHFPPAHPRATLPVTRLKSDGMQIYGTDRDGLETMAGYTSSYWLGQKTAEEYARLFAAAPDLLAACKMALDYAFADPATYQGSFKYFAETVVPSIEAAIAKAETA